MSLAFTIHPAVYIGGGVTVEPDFSPFYNVCAVAPKAFAINGAEFTVGMTQAQCKTIVEDKIAAYPEFGGPRLAYWEWEAAHNAGWTVSNMILKQNGAEEGGPDYTWGGYHAPWTNMYATTAGDMTATSTLNDGYASYFAECQVHFPDIYWLVASADNVEVTLDLNIAEVKRAITGCTSQRIVPFIATRRPNPDWVTTLPLEAATFASMAQKKRTDAQQR